MVVSNDAKFFLAVFAHFARKVGEL